MRRRGIFANHLYELGKGLRHLILFTTRKDNLAAVKEALESREIDYLVSEVGGQSDRVNVFFGHPVCIAVLTHFDLGRLSELSPEEDFILGTMLGYDRVQQCERYLRQLERSEPAATPALTLRPGR